jgi:hypothetical protein
MQSLKRFKSFIRFANFSKYLRVYTVSELVQYNSV